MNPAKAQRLAEELTLQWMRENRDRLARAGISVPDGGGPSISEQAGEGGDPKA